MDDVKAKLRTFLSRFNQNGSLADDQDIFASGFVNSLFAMELVMFTEREFGIAVEPDDLDLDNFRSINAIAELVRRKTPGP